MKVGCCVDYNKALEMIKLLESSVKHGVIPIEENEPYFIYGVGSDRLTIVGIDEVTHYNTTIDYLWKSDKDIFETLTRKDIINSLVSLLRKMKNVELNINMIRDMFSQLRSKPISDYEVIYQLYGVEYYNGNPLELGPFTIYNWGLHGNLLLNKYPHMKSDLAFWDIVAAHGNLNKNEVVLISVREKTRSNQRADEKGRIKLRQFEDSLRFMIADIYKKYDIGVFSFNHRKWSHGVMASEDGGGTSGKMEGVIDRIKLHQFPINAPQYGHDKIWLILAKSDATKMEQRIISAIEWVGKALRDEEPARAFVQYIIALEALLQFQQKNQMVSPSIVYQISEFVAFIISDNIDDRLTNEKIVKDLYATRSAIAHGGSTRVNEQDLFDAMSLLKHVLTSLLVHDAFNDIRNIDQLYAWVKKQKYS